MKIAIQTLGCKVNQSESASLEGVLRNSNYTVVRHTDSPDICIVNTCTVTAKSDYQSRQLIRRAIKSGARVVATGCYAQLRSEQLSEIEGLDLIIGNSGKNNILKYIQKISEGTAPSPAIEVDEPKVLLSYQPYYSSRSRAFLKIQDGCNYSCSYCTVPRARGKSRSLETSDVLQSVEKLSADGYREIVLTGIHIGAYGADLKPASSLLEIVEHITGTYDDVRIRLSSLEPNEVKDEFVELIKKGRVCAHLHIPLQSGSDRILKEMNRGYSTTYYEQVIHKIVTAYPDISLGTDIITGFPGESDKDFNATVKFLEKLPFSYMHVFPYSMRPNTKASLLPDQVSKPVKKSRVNTLIKIAENKKKDYKLSNIGKLLNVIVENKNATTRLYNAISDNYLRVFVDSPSLQAGQSIKVRVISMTDDGLIANPL